MSEPDKGKRSSTKVKALMVLGTIAVIAAATAIGAALPRTTYAPLQGEERDARGIKLSNPMELNVGECVAINRLRDEQQVTSRAADIQPCGPGLYVLSSHQQVTSNDLAAARRSCRGRSISVSYKNFYDRHVYCFERST
jgi:hypothetical protein